MSIYCVSLDWNLVSYLLYLSLYHYWYLYQNSTHFVLNYWTVPVNNLLFLSNFIEMFIGLNGIWFWSIVNPKFIPLLADSWRKSLPLQNFNPFLPPLVDVKLQVRNLHKKTLSLCLQRCNALYLNGLLMKSKAYGQVTQKKKIRKLN